MNSWHFIRLFNRKNLWSLFLLGVKNPLYVIPTLLATRKCIRICNKLYGNLHQKNNVTNAFRHALWNILIAQACTSYSRTRENAIKWAHEITTWHESFSPNDALARHMDMHNNGYGQEIFRRYPEYEAGDFISLLQDQLTSAVKISTSKEIEAVDFALVYIENLPK